MEIHECPIYFVCDWAYNNGHHVNNIESKENESKKNGGNSEEKIDEGKRG